LAAVFIKLDRDRFPGQRWVRETSPAPWGICSNGLGPATQKPFRHEGFGVGPHTRIVVGPVEIEENPVSLFEVMAFPLDAVAGPAADKGKEGRDPSHLLDEGIR
jgi:hypothetical protein